MAPSESWTPTTTRAKSSPEKTLKNFALESESIQLECQQEGASLEMQTIKDLRNAIPEAKTAIERFDPNDYEGRSLGQLNEYTPAMLQAEMKSLLTDIRGLVRAPKNFAKISTYEERQRILNLLQNIPNYMNNAEFHIAANSIDQLKIIIRSYHIRIPSESKSASAERLDELNAIFSDLEDKDTQATDLLKGIQDLTENCLSQHQNIRELLSAANAHEEAIAAFVQQIEARSSQLAKQQQSTEEYEQQLSDYAIQRGQEMEKSKDLIEKSKLALEYTTAAGVSAAFNERYIADKKWWKSVLNFLWVLAAGGSIAGAIYTIYPLLSQEEIGWGAYIARILIMPTAIGAAWFCAARYVRYNNITEDYGYKSVLAKSMVAFLDQFQGEERELYLKTVLKQLLQDPLRKQHDMEHPASRFLRRGKRPEKDDKGDK